MITQPKRSLAAYTTIIRRYVEYNSLDGVTWVHSYVAPDTKKSYCIFDAPTPEAVRRAARRNGLPIDRIVEVSVLDPYSYQWRAAQPKPSPLKPR